MFDKRTEGKPYKSWNVEKAPLGGPMGLEHRPHYDGIIHAAMEHFGIKVAVSWRNRTMQVRD